MIKTHKFGEILEFLSLCYETNFPRFVSACYLLSFASLIFIPFKFLIEQTSYFYETHGSIMNEDSFIAGVVSGCLGYEDFYLDTLNNYSYTLGSLDHFSWRKDRKKMY